MFLSFQTVYQQCQSYCSDASSTTKTLLQNFINQTQGNLLALRKDYTETSSTQLTVASQQDYFLPFNYGKMFKITVTVGSIAYPLESIEDDVLWRDLNARASQYTSQFPSFYYIFNDKVSIFPKPSAAGNTITMYYHKIVKDLSFDDLTAPGTVDSVTLFPAADYTTGTIDVVTNGSATVTGKSTIWTSSMAGAYMQIQPSPTSTASGDSNWYKISSVTNNTTLVLTTNYTGTSLTTGAGAAYTIRFKTLAGSGTSWTRSMEGRFIKISPSAAFTASGDGIWYEIQSVLDSTSISLKKFYGGFPLVTGAAASWTIGEMPTVPESYHELLVMRPVALYWQIRGDSNRFKVFWPMYETLEKRFIEDRSSKVEAGIITARQALIRKDVGIIDPNAFPIALTS